MVRHHHECRHMRLLVPRPPFLPVGSCRLWALFLDLGASAHTEVPCRYHRCSAGRLRFHASRNLRHHIIHRIHRRQVKVIPARFMLPPECTMLPRNITCFDDRTHPTISEPTTLEVARFRPRAGPTQPPKRIDTALHNPITQDMRLHRPIPRGTQV